MEGVADLQLGDDLVVVPTRVAGPLELGRVHTGPHLDYLRRFSTEGGGSLDADTYATPASWEIATRAAGAGLVAMDELRHGRAELGFVVARPPGHHALADRSMGFCLINNVAVAAAELVAAGREGAHRRLGRPPRKRHRGPVLGRARRPVRVDPSVALLPGHRPGLGRGGTRGPRRHPQRPPAPRGHRRRGAAGLRSSWSHRPWPGSHRHGYWYRPDSTPTETTPWPTWPSPSGDFAELARTVAGYAPARGRLLLFLEGGYELEALRTSVAATLGALVGAAEPTETPSSGGPGMEQVDVVLSRRREGLDRRSWSAAAGRPWHGGSGPPAGSARENCNERRSDTVSEADVMTFDTILVGVDGSDASVVLVGVGLPSGLDHRCLGRGRHHLAVADAPWAPPLPCRSTTSRATTPGPCSKGSCEPWPTGTRPCRCGPGSSRATPAEALVEATRHADLLVVGSRGHGAFAGMLLGSVSQHCASHAHCPVVIYRDDRDEPDSARRRDEHP